MWNLTFAPPTVVQAEVLTRLPDRFRQARVGAWSRANKAGQALDSFLEGPSFDRLGQLWLTDIPNGRIFCVNEDLQWELACAYDGWPNGSAFHRDGSLWIADCLRGLLVLRPGSAAPQAKLTSCRGETFKGLNDLVFDRMGTCYFTDQGQTGLQDPSGRVFRLGPDDRLELLLSNVPSPNGLALTPDESVLYVAATRANAVWRAPLPPSGGTSKVGVYQSFFGSSGPDGLAVDVDGRLVVAHASLGGAFVLDPRGQVSHYIASPLGASITNVCFRPGTNEVILVESQTGTVLRAKLPERGTPLYGNA